jgi:hypothetical protein
MRRGEGKKKVPSRHRFLCSLMIGIYDFLPRIGSFFGKKERNVQQCSAQLNMIGRTLCALKFLHSFDVNPTGLLSFRLRSLSATYVASFALPLLPLLC